MYASCMSVKYEFYGNRPEQARFKQNTRVILLCDRAAVSDMIHRIEEGGLNAKEILL